MIPEKYFGILQKLLDKTKRKEVIWQKTTRDDEYKLELQTGTITVDRWNDKKGTMAVDVTFYNDRGDKIDRLFANEEENHDDFVFIETLHSEVRRAYYKVDETLKGFLDEVDSPGKIGKLPPDPDDLPF